MEAQQLNPSENLETGHVLHHAQTLTNFASWLHGLLDFFLNFIDWNNPLVVLLAFLFYEYIVYNFKLYMIPLGLFIYITFHLITSEENSAHKPLATTTEITNNVEISVADTLQQEITQNILPVVAKIYGLLSKFGLSAVRISWITCHILWSLALTLHLLEFRYLMMIGGGLVFLKLYIDTNMFLKNLLVKLFTQSQQLIDKISEKMAKKSQESESGQSWMQLGVSKVAEKYLGIPAGVVSGALNFVTHTGNENSTSEDGLENVASGIASKDVEASSLPNAPPGSDEKATESVTQSSVPEIIKPVLPSEIDQSGPPELPALRQRVNQR